MDAIFGNDNQKIAAFERVAKLEAENAELRKTADQSAMRYIRLLKQEMDTQRRTIADLRGRLSKAKLHVIELQIQAR